MLVNNLPILPKGLLKATDLKTAAKDVLGIVKTTSEVTDVSKGYAPVPIVEGVPYYKEADAVTLAALGITATAEEINNIAGTTKAVIELISDAKTAANTYTDEKIAALVGSAPETLDTLEELATALKNNADIVDVLNEAIGKKIDKDAVFTAPTAEAAGTIGLVPAPAVGDGTKFLKGDGTWAEITSVSKDTVVEALGYTPAKVTVSAELTLTAAGWDAEAKTQTVTFAHNVEDHNSIDVVGASMNDWAMAGVYADSETATSITFKCNNEVPTSDLTFKVTSTTVNA